jgi:glycolate oxidase iron-sulfur subunit
MLNHEQAVNKLDQINACIHCGMCLSYCPTYLESGNEGNSPRGRLYLIRDMILDQEVHTDADQLIADTSDSFKNSAPTNIKDYVATSYETKEYLDNCLSCYACMTACPSGVEYNSLLDYARNQQSASNLISDNFNSLRRLIFKYILNDRNLLRLGRLGLKLNSILYKTFPWLPKFNKLQSNQVNSYEKIKTGFLYKTTVDNVEGYKPDLKKQLTLNLGCVMDTLYNPVHHHTIQVLNLAGYDVWVADTNCCGALASHSGAADIGAQQFTEFAAKLSVNDNTCVFNSAGCASFCKEHDLKNEIKDFAELLNPNNWQAPVPFDTFKENFRKNMKLDAVYQPACHLYHAQGLKNEYQNLLKAVFPKLNLISFYEDYVCCGSAGFYNLIKTEFAEKIGRRKTDNIKNTPARTVIAANPGCLSQLEAHLGKDYQTIHPISLLIENLN